MRALFTISMIFLITLTGLPARASTPRMLSHNSRTDFERGTFKDISILHNGKITLAPARTRLIDTGDPFVWAVVEDRKNNLYLATGNDGLIYKVSAGGDTSIFFDAKELEVYSLVMGPDRFLYAATAPNGKVYKIDAAGHGEVFFDPEDKYIWKIAFDSKGNLFVATGEKARLYKVTPHGESMVVFESEQTHLRSLVIDGRDDLYIGSSGKGYVYKLSGKSKPYVLYDTQLEEVHGLALAPNGEIYAAAFGESGAAFPDLRPQPTTKKTTSTGGTGSGAAQTGGEVSLSPQSIIPESMLRGAKAQTSLFRIDRNGYAKNLWLENDQLIMTLLMSREGDLLVGTGNKGKLYRVTRLGEISLVLSVEESQITALSYAQSGELLIGTSNMGRAYRLSREPVASATFESESIDTGALSAWGVLTWEGDLEEGAYQFYTRSGNTENPGKTWSQWAKVKKEGDVLKIVSPVARFLQWKCELRNRGKHRPILDKVSVSYLQNNLPPEITAVVVHRPGDFYPMEKNSNPNESEKQKKGIVYPQTLTKSEYKKGYRSVDWLFEDPNFDRLTFDVYYRRIGDSHWKEMAKDLEGSVYSWDTSLMADGRYEIKVVATDAPSNPASLALTHEKTSDPFVVDNTGPQISNIQVLRQSDSRTLAFRARDEWSAIKSVDYSIDAGPWQLLYPVDGISDSKSEQYEIPLPQKIQENLQIAIKVTDSIGNVTVKHTTVEGD